ncbi:unnamed protein product, partial [Discosporangium mesarthrocarpum]
ISSRQVFVCHDKRLKKKPIWLLYFEDTGWTIQTTEGPFGVWGKRYGPGQVGVTGSSGSGGAYRSV